MSHLVEKFEKLRDGVVLLAPTKEKGISRGFALSITGTPELVQVNLKWSPTFVSWIK